MKGIVYHGPRDLRFEPVADPAIQEPRDAIVRVERTAICGSDLHFYHGDPLPVQGFALGHEFLGTVEDVGAEVRRFRKGDRVLVSCTIGCGDCASCRGGLWSGCSTAGALGPLTNIFGSPLYPGGQAEAARVPFADTNLFPIPEGLGDEQVLFLTDILPTGAMGADLGTRVIIIVGSASLLADGLSMAASDYLASQSERSAHDAHGITDSALTEKRPVFASAFTFGAFVSAGACPLLPFLFMQEQVRAVWTSSIVMAAVLFLIGTLRTRVTGRRPWRAGVEMLLIGGSAAAIAFFVARYVSSLTGGL